MIQRKICYILIFSFLEEFVKGELVKSLFMIGTVYATIFGYDSTTIKDFSDFNALLVW